jgi:hypothetical protein
MNNRQRWQHAVSFKEIDHLPFWPKIGSVYLKYWQESYAFTTINDIFSYIGASQLHGTSLSLTKHRSSAKQYTTAQGNEKINTIETPAGTVSEKVLINPDGDSHPAEYYIKDKDDLKIMIDFFVDETYSVSQEAKEKCINRQNDIEKCGISWSSAGISPLMNFLQHLAGIENGHFFLWDYPDMVRELFAVMRANLNERVRLICEYSNADLVALTENTSTTLLSPKQYQEYCLPVIQDVAEICTSYNKKLALHMCGFLKDILPMLNETGASVFEAFTSPPVANTRLIDGRTFCPDVAIMGGTNAALWTQPAETIIAELKADLDCLPHHRGLVVSSAGMMPPLASPDTIKIVTDWIYEYTCRN